MRRTDVKDAAKTATAQLCQLIDPQHLHIVLAPPLASEPLLQLHHLDILEPNTRIDITVDNSFADIHPAADGGVVLRSHAVVTGKLVDLDLAELSDIADTLSIQRLEVRCDAR